MILPADHQTTATTFKLITFRPFRKMEENEGKVRYSAPGNQRKRKIAQKNECEDSSLSQSPLTVGQVMLTKKTY